MTVPVVKPGLPVELNLILFVKIYPPTETDVDEFTTRYLLHVVREHQRLHVQVHVERTLVHLVAALDYEFMFLTDPSHLLRGIVVLYQGQFNQRVEEELQLTFDVAEHVHGGVSHVRVSYCRTAGLGQPLLDRCQVDFYRCRIRFWCVVILSGIFTFTVTFTLTVTYTFLLTDTFSHINTCFSRVRRRKRTLDLLTIPACVYDGDERAYDDGYVRDH